MHLWSVLQLIYFSTTQFFYKKRKNAAKLDGIRKQLSLMLHRCKKYT